MPEQFQVPALRFTLQGPCSGNVYAPTTPVLLIPCSNSQTVSPGWRSETFPEYESLKATSPVAKWFIVRVVGPFARGVLADVAGRVSQNVSPIAVRVNSPVTMALTMVAMPRSTDRCHRRLGALARPREAPS